MTQDTRLEQLTQWVNSLPGWEHEHWNQLQPMPASAATSAPGALTAQPSAWMRHRTRKTCCPFVDITHRMQASGVHVPKLLAQNLLDGFLLLEDLGNTQLP